LLISYTVRSPNIWWLLNGTFSSIRMPWQCVPGRCFPGRKFFDYASLGRCVPWTMRPLDDSSLGRCVPWTMRPLDDASLGRCVPWTMRLLDDASFFGRCVPWLIPDLFVPTLYRNVQKLSLVDTANRGELTLHQHKYSQHPMLDSVRGVVHDLVKVNLFIPPQPCKCSTLLKCHVCTMSQAPYLEDSLWRIFFFSFLSVN
jgi:hypothetical protein